MTALSAENNASSSRTFFSTPELLEAFLLQASLRDLLVAAQRVNRSWHEMVASSPALQQKLFFQPCPRQEDREPEFNPLLQQAFPLWFENPSGGPPSRFKQEFSRGEPFKALQWNKNPATRNAYARREASWRRMLSRQPQQKALRVVKHSHFRGGNSKAEGHIQFQDGVRMGPLYDLIQEALAKPISSFVRTDEFLQCCSCEYFMFFKAAYCHILWTLVLMGRASSRWQVGKL